MTRRVKTVTTQSSLAEAIAIMDAGEYGQVPVMDGSRPAAMLTAIDARRAYMQSRQDRPILELASPLPSLLKPTTPLSAIQQSLQTEQSLLVISASGRLMGIITYWDVLELAQPFLLVTEVELLLRDVIGTAYHKAYGPDWWPHVPAGLRLQAEEEHQRDKAADPTPSAEHMLSHMTMWPLIESYKTLAKEIPAERFQQLHGVREFRNEIAHHAQISKVEIAKLEQECLAAITWLHNQMRKLLCRR
jgi:hypothetical protein